ncbi:MAG TPA: tyrosine-protein phosphatase, partial [Terriglobales bacterium]
MSMVDLARRLFLIALLAILCAGAQPQQQDDSPGYEPEPVNDSGPVKGVAGFTEVTPHLYRGGQPSQKGLESLAKMGINIVVDGRLTGDKKEDKEATKLGMQFVPIRWHCLYPKDEVFARFLALLRDNPDKKIFVHCRYGDDRTGMMIAAYRMAMQGWTWEEARKEMDDFGFHHKVCASLLW